MCLVINVFCFRLFFIDLNMHFYLRLYLFIYFKNLSYFFLGDVLWADRKNNIYDKTVCFKMCHILISGFSFSSDIHTSCICCAHWHFSLLSTHWNKGSSFIMYLINKSLPFVFWDFSMFPVVPQIIVSKLDQYHSILFFEHAWTFDISMMSVISSFIVSLQPLNPRQAMVKRLSVVNLENFKRQYARRRWKVK